jgi:prophage regulatory protein
MATMLDKTEVADMLGISLRKLEYLVSERTFPPGVRLGRRLFWLADAVERWRTEAFRHQLEFSAEMASGRTPSRETESARTNPVLVQVLPTLQLAGKRLR